MAEALEGIPEAPLTQPPGIITVRISSETGLVARAGEPAAMFEIFRDGHVPELQAESFRDSIAGESIDEDIF
jgi:penicillin-binding protein 1A